MLATYQTAVDRLMSGSHEFGGGGGLGLAVFLCFFCVFFSSFFPTRNRGGEGLDESLFFSGEPFAVLFPLFLLSRFQFPWARVCIVLVFVASGVVAVRFFEAQVYSLDLTLCTFGVQ